ncbi:MAG: GNAT family N-acetyltransferase [Armatimonadetes bacterium]|nr:GNAT family N-acetyltransferase [Armatimonadota bacterium]
MTTKTEVARTKRVLIAGIYHETHTFTPGCATLADFTILRGGDFWNAIGEPSPLGGVMETAQALGWEVVPAIDYRAFPCGIVEDAVLEAWWSEFHEAAKTALEAGDVHGVYLVLHGAMATQSYPDVEGELLERIRSIAGLSSVPIGGVTDLHANISPRMALHSNALITYHANPHTDAKERAVQAAHTLHRMLESERPAKTYWKQPPLVLAPSHTGTADEPMRTLEAMARRMEAEHADVYAVNVHAGFSFADTVHTGVSFTVNTVGEEEEAQRLLETLCLTVMRTPAGGSTDEMSVETAMARLTEYEAGPILLIEPSDNIGAGAPGEGVSLLKAFITHKVGNSGVIINDAEAVSTLSSSALGERRVVRIGGKSSPLYEAGCEIEVELVSQSDGRFTIEDPHSHIASMLGWQIDMGACAVVRHAGVTILLTTKPTPPFDLGQWRSQGVDPEKLFAVGVKAAVAHRQAYNPIARASLYVNTPGPCTSDTTAFPYRLLRRPICPLSGLPTSVYSVEALPSGEPVTLRPLQSDDSERFTEYVLNLSAETKSRYGPHPFDRATAEAICETLNPKEMLRMVATVSHNGEERIIAYVLLKMSVLDGDRKRYEILGIPLHSETDCTLAPSVADDYQNQGVGSVMMRHLLNLAPQLGRQRIVLWGGVQAPNERAVHFYTRWGFRKVGEFLTDKNNYDMILDLPTR